MLGNFLFGIRPVIEWDSKGNFRNFDGPAVPLMARFGLSRHHGRASLLNSMVFNDFATKQYSLF